MALRRFTQFGEAMKAAKSLPGSILRRDGNRGWVVFGPKQVVRSEATTASSPKRKKPSRKRKKKSPAVHRNNQDNGDDLGSCPRCGRPLVWRQGALLGETTKFFVGCSGFPKCRYTSSM